MIKFFRNIRRNLIGEGKSSKHLKYAIGEVILVVVGILIALAINNANEKRKINAFEIELLSELRLTVNDELKKMDRRLEEHQKSSMSCHFLIDALKQKIPYHDSIGQHFEQSFTIWGANFRYSGFENVKNHGLLFIENQELRYLLMETYETQTKFLETLLKRYDMYYFNTIAPELTHNFIHVKSADNNNLIGLFPKNYISNSNKLKHINMLEQTVELLRQIINTDRRIIRMLKELDIKLKEEIEVKH